MSWIAGLIVGMCIGAVAVVVLMCMGLSLMMVEDDYDTE